MTARLHTPSVPGIVTAHDLELTGERIAELQLGTGMIPWYPDGHCDPWNHVETAMALTTVGRRAEAERAYQWLADVQHEHGGWHNYYLADGVEDDKFDVNCIAYVATGVWHHYLGTGDLGFAETLWPVVDRAIEYVLELQTLRGEIIWARKQNGTPWNYALLTGSSSISHSLACARALAARLGHERPWWIDSRKRLVDTIVNCPEAFAPKDRWAMDWYYPVLAGALLGDEARTRLAQGWDTFVMEDRGVRCVSDEPWVTAAETCECAMAYLAVGDRGRALDLYRWAQNLRADDGAYFTGIVYPDEVNYPGNELTAYTSAAVILAADALDGSNPTSDLFLPGRDT